MNKIETLGIPLKKASDVDILKPLKNLIGSRYQSSDQESYVTAINELSKLRNNTVVKTLDCHENSLDLLYRYFDQLVALESKIPASEFQIPFKWKDAFDKGSIFGGRISLTVSNLAYEKVCVLFNIAAMQSQIAASQSPDSDESLKLAVKLFQSASGIFNHLKDIVHGSLQQDPTPDLQLDTLTALASLMIAQAQEVIAVKARSDNMKDAIVAKLFNQCGELYADALRNMQREILKPLWERDWIPRIHSKQIGFLAMANYHQSRVSNANKSVGDEIALLKNALELFKSAQTRSGDSSFANDIGRSQRAHDEAVKDNDFIYHERVPDVKNLEPIGKAVVAKSTPVPARFSTSFSDLFETLVPVVVQQALSQYDVRKSEIVNGEVSKLRENTQLLNSILASLNLPAAIEDTSGEKVPQSIREKSSTVCEKGGINRLNELLQELPELLKRNRDLLDESQRLLREEKESDDQLRNQFKEKWTRTASDKLTTSFVANGDKYRKVIETAVQADHTIRQKYDTHKEGMELLSRGVEAIASAMPGSVSNTATSSPAALTALRRYMEEVETMKAERDAIESELKSSETDMRNMFLGALAQDGAINEPALSVESLGRVYGPLQKQVQESLTRQEKLVAEIQKAHSEFNSGSAGGGGQREAMLKKLAAANDVFEELQANLQEGAKFYNDLTQLLVNFQSKINDFCFARRTEKEELMKDLTQGIANQPQNAAPQIPSHHKDVAVPERSAPPRPPPPQVPNPYQGAPVNMGMPQTAPSIPPYPAPQAPMNMGFQGVPPYPAPQNPTAPQGNLPYPMNPQGMPQPQATTQGGYQNPMSYAVYTPMPQGYNPYYVQQAMPPPPQYPGYPYPPQNPQWPPRT